MPPILDLLAEIDSAWKPVAAPRISLGVLGSAALFLQTNYRRGTKDGDVLETEAIDAEVRDRLVRLGGPGSALHLKHRLFLDVVSPNVPMLPADPLWRVHPSGFASFAVEVLDVHDVVVSKLKRWNAGDRDDVRAMAEGGHIDQPVLVTRFGSVVDRYRFDARSDLLPTMAARLNLVERDWLALAPTPFEFPEELFR